MNEVERRLGDVTSWSAVQGFELPHQEHWPA